MAEVVAGEQGVDDHEGGADVWGHDNLHIVDASLHVTNGGVNPVLTILALAYRIGHEITRRTITGIRA